MMTSKPISIVLSLMLILSCLAAVPALAKTNTDLNGSKTTVNTTKAGDTLRIRKSPDKGATETVDYVKNKQAITLVTEGATGAENWSKVKVTKTGKTGYLKNKYIQILIDERGYDNSDGEISSTSSSSAERAQLTKLLKGYIASDASVDKILAKSNGWIMAHVKSKTTDGGVGIFKTVGGKTEVVNYGSGLSTEDLIEMGAPSELQSAMDDYNGVAANSDPPEDNASTTAGYTATVMLVAGYQIPDMVDEPSQAPQDGGYMQYGATEDGAVAYTNRSFAPAPDLNGIDAFLMDCAAEEMGALFFNEFRDFDGADYSKQLSYPTYLASWNSGEDDDPREHVALFVLTDSATLMYQFGVSAESFDDYRDQLYKVFDSLTVQDIQ